MKMLLRKLKPSSVVNVLFTEQCFFSKSSKMRENSLLCLLYALMIFPSTEFNITGLTNVLMQYGCHEPKRRVRQALLDTYAVLGQFSPFYSSSIVDTDDKDMRLFKKAVLARLARRQLPTVSPEGLILYALQVTSASKGPDVDWVQAGNGSFSIGSAESQSQFSMAPFLTSDQQHSFPNGVWGETVNEIMVTGVPPVSLNMRDTTMHPLYSNSTKIAQDASYSDDRRFFYQSYEFPHIKRTNLSSNKVEDLFGKNTGAPSRGIKTWPLVENSSKFPPSPIRAADVELLPDQIAQSHHPRSFSSNANNSNLPAIVSPSLPEWRLPSWAENSYYYPKATSLSKWGRQDEFLNDRDHRKIDALGDTVHNNNTGFSENRSTLNNYTVSTSVHHKISQIAPMQPNDYMALPTHIVNLPNEDMNFASNGNTRVENILIKSVPNSKSYENLPHKNGFGERFKYNSFQQRRQPEAKANVGSSLYPNTLQPFDSPKDALEKCALQIESPEWEIVMQSLQGIVRLSRHHPEVLVAALHRIVTGLSKQIRSLRSQVTKAACVVSQELFEHLGKIMDPEIEELAPALLSRTFDANKFLQHDANAALDSMIDNVSPVRSVTFLLVKGAKHRNAVVRTTACRLLARLCQNLGVEQLYSLPRDTRDSLLNAAAKFLLEGSLDTRAHAKEVFTVLAREPKFMRLMNEVVPAKTMEAVRKPLIKVISQK